MGQREARCLLALEVNQENDDRRHRQEQREENCLGWHGFLAVDNVDKDRGTDHVDSRGKKDCPAEAKQALLALAEPLVNTTPRQSAANDCLQPQGHAKLLFGLERIHPHGLPAAAPRGSRPRCQARLRSSWKRHLSSKASAYG